MKYNHYYIGFFAHFNDSHTYLDIMIEVSRPERNCLHFASNMFEWWFREKSKYIYIYIYIGSTLQDVLNVGPIRAGSNEKLNFTSTQLVSMG